ncbi:hypothetical protein Tco_1409627 [Tanacetum coccineum]
MHYWNPLTKATQWETPTKAPPYNQVHLRGVQQHGPEYPNQMGQQPDVEVSIFIRVDALDKFRSPIKKNMEELKKQQKLGEPPEDAVVVKPMTAMEIRSKIAMICGVAVRSLKDIGQIQYELPLTKFCLVLINHQPDGQFNMSRGVYYKHADLFYNSETVLLAIDRLCVGFGCARESLGLYSSSKGKVCGDLIIRTAKGESDCTFTKSVPNEKEIKDLKIVTRDCDFILVIEKETMCLVVTDKGEPDISTRLFVHKLRYNKGLPVIALVDGNPYGVKIASVYKHGSMAKALQSQFTGD